MGCKGDLVGCTVWREKRAVVKDVLSSSCVILIPQGFIILTKLFFKILD